MSKPLFRSRYQPERILHDVMFGLAIAGIGLMLLFLGGWAIGAARHKEPCSHYDSKRGWGHDEANRACKRRPG